MNEMNAKRSDETGMVLHGRCSATDRYIYSVGGIPGDRVLYMTHEQRVGIAKARKLLCLLGEMLVVRYAEQAAPIVAVAMVEAGEALTLHKLDADAGRVLARALASREQRTASRAQGAERFRLEAAAKQKSEAYWYAKLYIASKGWTSWPKTTLRHRMSDSYKMRRRMDKYHAEKKRLKTDPVAKWKLQLKRARAHRSKYEKAAERAALLVEKWKKNEKKAERWLAEASRKQQQRKEEAE